MRSRRIRTVHRVASERIPRAVRFAVIADLHSAPFEDVLEDLTRCDAVLMPGDLVDRHRKNNTWAERFLEEVPRRLPVFYSVGNHERKFRLREEWMQRVARSEAILLDNAYTVFMGLRLGGLSSVRSGTEPDLAFLDAFEQQPEYKLLMCHHPEMYRDYVRGRNIDLTLCGHAHGGQIQIGGRGLYAPGQGFFPELTHGVHDGGRMLISRGMTNGAKPRIPRINNPCELILLEMNPKGEGNHDEGRAEPAG